MNRTRVIWSVMLVLTLMSVSAHADTPFDYAVSVSAQASSGNLAPYMLGSWNDGNYSEASGIWQEAEISKAIDLDRRFSWSAGLGYIAGIDSDAPYRRWDETSGSWTEHNVGLPPFRLTQLFGEVKFRGVFLTLGMKKSSSRLLDDDLTSGDLTRSNNAAPIPGIAVGFIDFQNIPFTNGWVQIDGEMMFGKTTDNSFKKGQFNHYSGVLGLNIYYNYKRCYFRTNPKQPFHITIGMQAAGLFGGTSISYMKGAVYKTEHRGLRLSDIFQMMLPRPGGEYYYTGSHLGSWDFKADYRFHNGSSVSAYFEWPWEDGSGIGRMNGWDGLWGIQYNFAKKGIISKAVIEYLDFTNQSGPIHYDPEDNPNSPITGHAQGADNYYNNDFYGPYSLYGMSIGSPFLISPIYNSSGMQEYLHTRARGFHVAIEGNPLPCLSYLAKVSYQTAGGAGWRPAPYREHSTSAMLEARTRPIKKLPGLEFDMTLAFDCGSLRGDNFGSRLKISYSGDFSIRKKSR